MVTYGGLQVSTWMPYHDHNIHHPHGGFHALCLNLCAGDQSIVDRETFYGLVFISRVMGDHHHGAGFETIAR